MIQLVLSLTALFTLACHSSADTEYEPALDCEHSRGTAESIDTGVRIELRARLENFSKTVDGGREEQFHPSIVLPQVHPWFRENLCEKDRYNQPIFMLAPIPDLVIADLKTAAAGPHKDALAILSGDFWAKVQRMQQKGLKPGFLQFSKDFEVAGFYEYHTQTVGLDVFANPGTPDHEYRHHLQKMELPNPRRPRRLSARCAEQTARFLGELDATTIQLPHWVGAFDGLAAEGEEPRERRYPQAGFLGVNLNYPALASTWVKAEECPEELVTAVRKIVDRTQVIEMAATTLAPRLVNMVHSLARLLREQKTACPGNEALCQLNLQRVEKTRAEIRRLKSELNTLLTREAKERPDYTREILLNMPYAIKRDLNNYSGAYRLIVRQAKEGLWD